MRGIKDKSTNLVVDKGLVLQDMGPVLENNSFRSSSLSVVTSLCSNPLSLIATRSQRNVLVLSLHVKRRTDELQKPLGKLDLEIRVGELRLVPDSPKTTERQDGGWPAAQQSRAEWAAVGVAILMLKVEMWGELELF